MYVHSSGDVFVPERDEAAVAQRLRMLVSGRVAGLLPPAALATSPVQGGFRVAIEYRTDAVTLSTFNSECTAEDMDDKVDIAVELAQAVAACHAAGFYHQQLSAERVLVGDEITVVDPFIGTVYTPYSCPRNYRAPESILNLAADVDGATDVWAVGCLLFELLTGECLFEVRSSRAEGSGVAAPAKVREQLEQIFAVVGGFSDAAAVALAFEKRVVDLLAATARVDRIRRCPPQWLPVIERCLQVAPRQRASMAEVARMAAEAAGRPPPEPLAVPTAPLSHGPATLAAVAMEFAARHVEG